MNGTKSQPQSSEERAPRIPGTGFKHGALGWEPALGQKQSKQERPDWIDCGLRDREGKQWKVKCLSLQAGGWATGTKIHPL
jgi:hypothetical protein